MSIATSMLIPDTIATTIKYSWLQPDNLAYLEQTVLDPIHSASEAVPSKASVNIAVESLDTARNFYRKHGHKFSKINPLASTLYPNQLANSQPQSDPKYSLPKFAPNPSNHLIAQAYSGTVSLEAQHIDDKAEQAWLFEQHEACFAVDQPGTNLDHKQILDVLIAATEFEIYLARKFPGAKRFGLEGCESLLVLMYYLCQQASTTTNIEFVNIGMPHRGRLNLLINLLGKPLADLLAEFDTNSPSTEFHQPSNNYDPEFHSPSVNYSGDVKYHMGYQANLKFGNNLSNLKIQLAYNPSHLELVSPVVIGQVRAYLDQQLTEALPIILHGDAAFSGQGIVMELFNMAQISGYTVGGSIHIIVNNQIGFTTDQDSRSTRHCSDLGKAFDLPIWHVNAEDPEAVALVANLALKYRQKFHKDCIINLVGYRLNGHNEADEPAVTQPLMYQEIRAKTKILALYQQKLLAANKINQDHYNHRRQQYAQILTKASQVTEFLNFQSSKAIPAQKPTEHNSQLTKAELINLAKLRDKIPEQAKLHSRLLKIIQDRELMSAEQLPLDWGYAETLAYASLLEQGYKVRISGQDVGRGTFFHRHLVWHDQDTGEAYINLAKLQTDPKTKLSVFDSLLSELAVLGFEYGYAVQADTDLVVWEAQFGDFVNCAQTVIDQFISSAEQKWRQTSNLTLLLPHGYEGQGPEHSSARFERFLQLCAQDNLRVCVPTTPAQIYHLLRRQVLSQERKPLIAITPKSLLRHKLAVASLEQLAYGQFQAVLTEDADLVNATAATNIAQINNITKANKISHIIFCTGKIYYELLEYKLQHQLDNYQLIRIEQLYPFPSSELQSILKSYDLTSNLKLIWCQEEPRNQGAWSYIRQQFIDDLHITALQYAGRAEAASPAVGKLQEHLKQQQALIQAAFK